MTDDGMVPAYLYEQLCGELLIDPEQVSADITALIEEIRRALEPATCVMTAVVPPPPVRKDPSS